MEDIILKENRDLFDQKLYPKGEMPNASSLYVLYRYKNNILESVDVQKSGLKHNIYGHHYSFEILFGCADIINADNAKNEMNRKNDGWEYEYLESDYDEKSTFIY